MKDYIESQAANNIELNNKEIENRCFKLESTPPLLHIDFIGICNMTPHCPMCLNWDGAIGPRHHLGMKIDDFLKFGKFFHNASVLINCGIGEPLLNKDLIEILKLFSKEKKEFGINSNGLALKRDLADKIIPFSPYLTIIFSIDAASRETYSKLRANNFDEVIENIAYYCQKRRKEFGSLKTKTGICFLPMKLNKHEVPDFIKLGARIGVDVVELRSLNEVDHQIKIERKGFVFDYQEQQLSMDELDELRHVAQKEADRYGIRFDCQYSFDVDYTYEYFVSKEFKHLNIPCLLPWRFLLPYQNGDTIGCCYMNRSLGNWREIGLDLLWNGAKMQNIRRELASGKLAKECLQYRSCPIVGRELKRSQSEYSLTKLRDNIRTPLPFFKALSKHIPILKRPYAFIKRITQKLFGRK